MTLSAPAATSSRTFSATSVLMLLPRQAHTPVVVLTDGPVPSSVRLDIHASRDLFVRIRRGPSMHGLWEPYRELAFDELPAESAVIVSVGADRYAPARFPCTASVFGAVDAVVLVPKDEGGKPFDRVRIPVPSLDEDSWHEFELVSESRSECRYRLVREGQFGLAQATDAAHE